MKALTHTLICSCIALAAGSAAAADNMMKKSDSMAKDGMKGSMSMQECKDHMAMAKKDNMKKDDAMMKMDAQCAEMMKKEPMAKDTMKK